MKKQYLVRPGYTRGGAHVSAKQLINLYRVDPRECVIVNEDGPGVRGVEGLFTVLVPRNDGSYEVSKCEIVRIGY